MRFRLFSQCRALSISLRLSHFALWTCTVWIDSVSSSSWGFGTLRNIDNDTLVGRGLLSAGGFFWSLTGFEFHVVSCDPTPWPHRPQAAKAFTWQHDVAVCGTGNRSQRRRRDEVFCPILSADWSFLAGKMTVKSASVHFSSPEVLFEFPREVPPPQQTATQRMSGGNLWESACGKKKSQYAN